EDGIRDRNVTGAQTCALPISDGGSQLRTSGSICPQHSLIKKIFLPIIHHCLFERYFRSFLFSSLNYFCDFLARMLCNQSDTSQWSIFSYISKTFRYGYILKKPPNIHRVTPIN